jgi:hypothetical protein
MSNDTFFENISAVELEKRRERKVLNVKNRRIEAEIIKAGFCNLPAKTCFYKIFNNPNKA